MRNHFKRTVMVLVTVSMLLSAVTVGAAAATYRKGANEASSSYRSNRFYDHFTKVPLTGNGRTDVLAVALSQVGYQEGSSVDQLGGIEGTSGNFTEYNYNMGDFSQGYGGKNYPWCASFVSFCLYQSRCTDQNGIADWCRKHTGDSRYIWCEVSCNQWASQLRRFGYFQFSQAKNGSYIPRSADLIFFTKDGKSESHIGLVLYVKGDTVYTVEGNTSSASGLETNGGGVYVKSYALSDACIMGFGVLPYRETENTHAIDYSGAVPTAGIYVATTNKYVYTTATATSYQWLLPKYSLLAVTEVASNGRLRAVCKIGNEWVEGYVKNNSDRVIQLSALGVKQADTPLLFSEVCRELSVSAYRLNGEKQSLYQKYFTGNTGERLEVEGKLTLTRPIDAMGYYVDGDRSAAVWKTVTPVSSVSFSLAATIPPHDSLLHTLTLAVRLTDGSVYVIDTLTFTVLPPPETEAPTAPPTDPPTEAPTEAPTAPPETKPAPPPDLDEMTNTEEPSTKAPELPPNGGERVSCGAAVPVGGALTATAAACLLLKRKREDCDEA